MCGRARCTLRADDVPRACYRNSGPSRTIDLDRHRPSYNVSPGFNMAVVRREDASDSEGYVLHCMKWGLIPSFTRKTDKPDHYKMFNARSESIGEKASFRRLIPKNRCLVAVEGFYEWKKDGSRKQPYYIHSKDGHPLVFAALYDSWQNSEGEVLYTFSILTTSSSSALQWLHDRMPVILGDKGSTDAWLNGSDSSYKTLLKPYEEPDLAWYPVTPAMGKQSFDGPECIKEIQLKTEGKISKFFSKKGNEREDTKPEDLALCHGSVKSELPKSLNDGRETHEQYNNLKSSDLYHFQEDAPEHQIKRDFEDFSADSKPVFDNSNQLQASPVKNQKVKAAAGDKQHAPKHQIKRDFEDFSADSEPVFDNSNLLKASPVKNQKVKAAAGDKQPTLFSYFGKS